MKLFTFILLFICQVTWAKQSPELKVGPASPAQFTFQESEEGDKITIRKVGKRSRNPQIVHYTTTTISQTHRLHIDLNNRKNQKKSIDLLVVVAADAAKTQVVQVFIPVRDDDFIISKNISPVCSLENFGGFYLENPEAELLKMFIVEEKQGRVVFSAMIQKDESSERKATECFKVMVSAAK